MMGLGLSFAVLLVFTEPPFLKLLSGPLAPLDDVHRQDDVFLAIRAGPPRI
jgi:hypothetical protein